MRLVLTFCLALLAWPALAADPADFSAQGNEPAWSLQLGLGGVSLSSASDKGVATWLLPKAEPVSDGLRYASVGNPTVLITRAICRDTMSGMPYPATVRVTKDDQTLNGCGGDPATLLRRNAWRVTAIAGAAFPADVPLEGTMAFDATGMVSGKAFCNRFTGSYKLGGEGLGFGPLAGTRMACPEPLSALEKAMFDALAKTTRFDLGDDGTLTLLAGDSTVLTAVPASP